MTIIGASEKLTTYPLLAIHPCDHTTKSPV